MFRFPRRAIGAVCSLLALAMPACAGGGASASAGASPAPAAAPAAQEGEAPEQVAARAASRWLELVDFSRYEASWDSAAALLQQSMTSAEWRETMIEMRLPLEPFGTRRFVGGEYTAELPNAPPGEYAVLQYEADVGGRRTAVETIVSMREADRGWRVVWYSVEPR